MRSKIFPGWYVVVAAAVGLTFGLSTFLAVCFGLFLKPLSEEFDWTRSEVSFALTISTTAIIICSPFVGTLIDRRGVRPLLLPGIVFFGSAVASLGLMSASLLHLYGMFLIVTLLGLVTLPASYSRVILNWFDEKRGLALGIGLSGVGIGAVIMPPVIQGLISTLGWRAAYLVIGLTIIVVNLPIAMWLLREKPSDVGLGIDGDQFRGSDVEMHARVLPCQSALFQSLRTKSFGLLAVVFLLMGLATIGTSAHLMAMLTDHGLSESRASGYMSLLGITLLGGRIICGYLVDRCFAPHVAFGFLGGSGAGLLMLGSGVDGWATGIAICLLGLAFGAEFDLMSYLISRYLGLANYGQIYGVVYAVFNVGAGLGPLIMGWLYDSFGSYSMGLYMFAVAAALAALLMLFLGPYREPRLVGEQALG